MGWWSAQQNGQKKILSPLLELANATNSVTGSIIVQARTAGVLKAHEAYQQV
jgi:hypothetical protein